MFHTISASDEPEQFHQALLQQYAAGVIQRWVRGWLGRREAVRQRTAAVAAQAAHEAAQAQQAQHAAASRIQLTFRSWRCRQAFHHLHRFIKAAENSNPRVALAAVGQGSEAALADCAAGVKVRFRLAGTTGLGSACPLPSLMFAVVTHRPVAQVQLDGLQSWTDAPQPSTAERLSYLWRPVPRHLYIKAAGLRSLTTQVQRSASGCTAQGAALAREASLGKAVSSQQRPQASKRRRRLHQLQQMYVAGKQEEAAIEPAASIHQAAAEPSSRGEGVVEYESSDEEDPSALLAWSKSLLLDYAEYTRGWQQLGGSAWTDRPC